MLSPKISATESFSIKRGLHSKDQLWSFNKENSIEVSTLTIDSGATITNSGTASGFGLSTGKAIVLAMLFGR